MKMFAFIERPQGELIERDPAALRLLEPFASTRSARREDSGPRRGRGFGRAAGSDVCGHGHVLGHILIHTYTGRPGGFMLPAP